MELKKDEAVLETGVVIIKTIDGDYHQAMLTNDEMDKVLEVVRLLQNGTIKVGSTKILGITF
jgi:hypothetical protein